MGPTIECPTCFSKPKFGTINEYILHQKNHAVDRNFLFTCPSCSLQFVSFNAIDLHVRYYHGDIRNIPQGVITLHACILAGCDEKFPSTKLLCQHLKKDHQEKGIKTQCPFKEECKSQNFFSKQTFSVHLSQHHKGWNSTSNFCPSTFESNSNYENLETYDTSSYVDMDISSDEDFADSIPGNNYEDIPQVDPREERIGQWREDFYRNVAMLYLRLESLHLVPVRTINFITQSVAELTATNLSIMREVIVQELEDVDLSEAVKERMVNRILSSDHLFAVHHKDVAGPTLTTNALRKAYYRTHFDYIKPKEINLSRDPNNPRHIYYCSLKKTLGLFLQNSKVQEEVQASFNRESKEGLFQDYQDGSLHKKRKEARPEKCIDLLIFTDEFTPTKDLSSVANLHKILGMYYTIGNLPSYLRAKLDCKRLIMLVPDSKNMFTDFKHGIYDVVVKALKNLQNKGITFMGEQVKVRLRLLLGDNKGQHEIGGFIQSFSAEYFCRYCSLSKTEIRAEPWKVGPLRTADSYEEASQSVPADRATFMGVSRPEWQCPFDILEDFHVCDPSLAPCIAHDLFEGVINYDLSLIIQHFVLKKKWFTYPQLNRKIKKFEYHGHDSGNKPAPVRFDAKKKNSKPTSLGGHAVQNWTLLRLLPFILDEGIIKDYDDSHWRLYISLKEITEFLCAPSVTLSGLGHLKVMIEDYMELRKSILGDGKPKHHYFAHYADLISILGPLIHLSGLGFEQFHQFFKNAAKAGKNFVDLGHSLTKKYCLYLAYLSASSPFVKGVTILDHGITVATQKAIEMDEEFQAALVTRNIPDTALLMTKIEVDGLLFKQGQWLLLGNCSDREVETAMITSVILDGNSVFFMLERHISTYNPNIGIYFVNESRGLACVPRNEIKYPLPQSIYEWGNHDKCFSLKHSL